MFLRKRQSSEKQTISEEISSPSETKQFKAHLKWKESRSFYQYSLFLALSVISSCVLFFFYREKALIPPAILPQETTDCDDPHFQYALMLDAGSTGSRIHIYKFVQCPRVSSKFHLDSEEFAQITPGLSSYIHDPHQAAKSLEKLMHKALDVVPREKHSCTPMALKATAGLRLLNPEQAEIVLQTVHSHLSQFPFKVVQNGISVMDGKDEAIYAWITVNYLLGNIGNGSANDNTVGVLDLGGASTQIVFQPHTGGDEKLEYNGETYELFQNSYLRYGLMEARKRVQDIAGEQTKCHDEEMDFHECFALIQTLFDKSAQCERHPCSFNGVFQPRLSETFHGKELYIFSYFYDRLEKLELTSDLTNEKITVEHIKLAAMVMCKTKDGLIDEERRNRLLKKIPDYCLDLTFMYALLSVGYEIPDHREVKVEKKIKGVETGWCLGAAIHMVDEMFKEAGLETLDPVCHIPK